MNTEKLDQETMPAVVENKVGTGLDMLTVLAQAVSQPNMSAEVIHRLIDAQERILDRQAEIDFNTAMADLRKELNTHPVMRSRSNTQTKSKYADLEDVKMVVDPLMSKYGFFDRYEDDFPEPGVVGTTCEIVHVAGHAKRNRVQFRLDDKGIAGTVNKTPVHAAASSMTYGQRLSLCRALGVRISEDDDGNAAGSKTITDEQISQIEEWLDATNSNRGEFMKYMGVKQLHLIPAVAFKKAMTALEAKKHKMEA